MGKGAEGVRVRVGLRTSGREWAVGISWGEQGKGNREPRGPEGLGAAG